MPDANVSPDLTSASDAAGASDFDRLFHLSPDLMCIAGLDDGRFRRVNPSWTRVLGWSEAELLARPVHEFMHPEDRERTLQARAGLAQGVPVRGLENRYLCKDGSSRWLSWQSITESGRPLVFAVARDITEQRESEHERLILGKLESTGLLAGGIAHDYNNLLAALLLNIQMVGLSGPVNTTQKQLLRQAQSTITTATELTRQLLNFAGSDMSARQPQHLDRLVSDALELTLRDTSIRRELTVDPQLRRVRGNETQLTQVFRGLLLNARDAVGPQGSIRVTLENLPTATVPALPKLPPGDYVRLTVADDGPGIASDILPKIFDPYFSTKERGVQKGMGLGLTVCRAVLERHGGGIVLASQPGRGTTVSCYLPAGPRAAS